MAGNDYRMFTVTNLPDSSGQYDVKDIRRDISSLINNAIKSALPENAYFKVGEKQLAPNGQMSVNVYVHKDQAYLAEASARQQMESLTHKGSISPRYEVSGYQDVDDSVVKALVADEKEMNKEKKEDIRFTRGTLLRVFGVLTAIADITRRILSSVINMSQQTAKDMITANNLSMSYDAVRTYRHVETTHGMKEGTIVGGITDIQKMFGNITALDEKSLEALAVVMGGEIKEAIDMGLGASNPEKVLGMILDKFNAQANAGYNSIGQQVGEVQARRELYSYLLKISPQIADIFATMQEEQHNVNSVWRGAYDTFEGMKNAFPTERNVTPAQRNASATAGQEWDKAKDSLDQIKESFLLSLVPAVLRISRWLSNNRAFMSETEKARLNQENYAKNEAFIRSAEMTISAIESGGNLTDAQKSRVKLLKEAVKNARKMNESGEDNITFEGYETTYELQLAVENDLRALQRGKTYLANKAGKRGTIAIGNEFALSFTDEEIARVLAGHPNKENELKAKYNKAVKDQDKAYREAKATAEGNRAEVARAQLLSLQSENTDEKRIERAKKEQNRKVLAGEVENTKALKQARSSGDLSIHTAYSDLLAVQELFPGVDLLHNDKGKELSYKDAIAKGITLGYVQWSKNGYGLDIVKPLPAMDMNKLRREADAYAWEKVPNVFPPENMPSFYQWAFREDPLFFNQKGLSYQTEDKIKASYTDEGNALYELTHGVWEKAMQAVAQSLASGSYNGNARVVFSSKDVVDETGIIQHKFMFSITKDGKMIANDVPIETVITGARWGDHDSLYSTDVNINNGSVSFSQGKTPSQMTEKK